MDTVNTLLAIGDRTGACEHRWIGCLRRYVGSGRGSERSAKAAHRCVARRRPPCSRAAAPAGSRRAAPTAVRVVCNTSVFGVVFCRSYGVAPFGPGDRWCTLTGGIGDWLRRHRHNTPDRIALREVETGASWTFADLDRRTDALAAALRAQGTARGDRVGLVTVNSAHMLEVIFAVAKLGAVAVPINVRLSAEEIQYILTDSGAGTVFVSAPPAATAAQATAGTQVTWVVQIPAAAQRREGTDSEFEQLISGAPQGPVTAEVDGGDLAMLMYTSGTTGKPKGAMLTHDNML